MGRIWKIGLISAALAVAAPSTVLAHECIVAPRSDTGNAGTSNSKVWFYLSTEFLARDLAGAAGLDPDEVVDDELIAEFAAALEAEGLPTSFSVFGLFTLGANPHTFEDVAAYVDSDKSTDLKGIDRIGEDLFLTYLAVFLTVV